MNTGTRLLGQLTPQPLTRPAELFRADLISAMKLPDSHPLEPTSYVEIKEPWRTEWEIGVQVCVAPQNLPQVSVSNIRSYGESSKSDSSTAMLSTREFTMSSSYMTEEEECIDEDSLSRAPYDLDELDLAWLDSVNQKRKFKVLAGSSGLSEVLLQQSITLLERKCYKNMMHAVRTDESLRIEYDDSIVCDVCRDPESEESNEMVFCDMCNICVHQACYGVTMIPDGSWLCKPCSIHQVNPPCVLCPNRSGALKRIKPSPGWSHVSCALWIPEVKVGNAERMEPVTNIEGIPTSRWNLLCCVCKKKEGACIQCSYPTCVSAYHVTCGFRSGLEMRSHLIYNGVLHESYCPKHTALRKTPSKLMSPQKTIDRVTSQLQEVEELFYKYSTPQDLVKEYEMSSQLALLIYNYWKLKRKSCHNHPLIPVLHVDLTLQRAAAGLQPDMKSHLMEDDHFLTVVHARHNLEKARNLVYMVQRRERLKRQFVTLSQEITHHELKIMEEDEAIRNEETKPPLCLKRLGISQEALKASIRRMENGLDSRHDGDINDSESSENMRTLRKQSLRSHSNSDDNGLLTSPKRCRHLSEGCTFDGVTSSNNDRHTSAGASGGLLILKQN